MTRKKFSPPVIVMSALFGLAIIVQFAKIPVLLAEDEMDEELRSTIQSDPTYRGRRSPAPTQSAAPASSESAPPPAATPSSSSSSSGGGDDEGSEWRTMHSETHRSWSGSSSGGGWSPVQIDLTKNRVFTPKISFGANSDVPTPQSTNVLKRVAETLGKRPDLAVRIEGHTDSIGYDQPNLELSQRRADHVRDILVQNGVPANRLQSVGMGDRNPVASSTTLDGQEKNRRVEFHISGVAAAPAPAQPAAPVAATGAVPVAPVPQPTAPAPVAAAPVPTAPVPSPPQPMAALPVAPAPIPQPVAPAPIPVAPAPVPQPMATAPAAPAPAPAPGLVTPPQPAPAALPPAPFGVRTQ